jgi:hypothetical protein
VLTKPADALFNKLTVSINGGPNDDANDLFPVPLTFAGFAIDNLTDQDIDDIVQIVVNRINTDHPDYIVYVDRAWSGTRGEARDIVYVPPQPTQP